MTFFILSDGYDGGGQTSRADASRLEILRIYEAIQRAEEPAETPETQERTNTIIASANREVEQRGTVHEDNRDDDSDSGFLDAVVQILRESDRGSVFADAVVPILRGSDLLARLEQLGPSTQQEVTDGGEENAEPSHSYSRMDGEESMEWASISSEMFPRHEQQGSTEQQESPIDEEGDGRVDREDSNNDDSYSNDVESEDSDGQPSYFNVLVRARFAGSIELVLPSDGNAQGTESTTMREDEQMGYNANERPYDDGDAPVDREGIQVPYVTPVSGGTLGNNEGAENGGGNGEHEGKDGEDAKEDTDEALADYNGDAGDAKDVTDEVHAEPDGDVEGDEDLENDACFAKTLNGLRGSRKFGRMG